MKVNCMLIILLIFGQFRTYVLFFSSYPAAYVGTVLCEQEVKMDTSVTENSPVLCLINKVKVNCMAIVVMIFWQFRTNVFSFIS